MAGSNGNGTVDPEILKKSVTAGDQGLGGSVWNFWVANSTGYQQKLLPDLPAYWSWGRDDVLRMTPRYEPFWSGCLKIMIGKMASAAWDIQGPNDLRTKRFQRLLKTANAGKGWVNFIKQHGRDYWCTDNGAHIEVVRATGAIGSKVLGIMHLDSRRCRRTGDPEVPIVYRDLRGVEHEMKYYQVISMADDPDPADSYFGVGFCAASGAYDQIKWMAWIQRFRTEKVSGEKPKALDFVSGVSDVTVQEAIESGKADNRARGYVAHLGSILIPTMSREGVTGYRVNFAELPEGFDFEKELKATSLCYANNFKTDPQDFQPLTGHAIGTGAQSQVLEDKNKGGITSWKNELEYNLNEALPEDVSMFFVEDDYRDRKQKAEIFSTWATAVSTTLDKGLLTQPQGVQKLVDEDQLPQQMLAGPDLTPGLTLSESEKPDAILPAPPSADQIVQQVQAIPSRPA
jgi:hypothetical protein